MTSSHTPRLPIQAPEGIKSPVAASTVEDTVLQGLQIINGYMLNVNDRVLVKDQMNPAENGIYSVQNGTWIRTQDWKIGFQIANGVLILDNNTGILWRCVYAGVLKVGATPVTFEQVNTGDGIGSGAIDYAQEETPEGQIVEGARWYIPSESSTYYWYVDEDGGQWVQEVTPTVNVDPKKDGTVSQLVALDRTHSLGEVVRVNGFYVSGDFDTSSWKKIGTSSDTNKLPEDTQNGTLITVSGDVFQNIDERVNAKVFGVNADGTDDTLKLSAFLNHLRTTKKPGFIPSGTYKTSAPLDISGVEVSGIYQGYEGRDGTIIEGSGDHDIFVQSSQNLSSTTNVIDGFSLRNGLHGLSLGYSLNTSVKNIYMKDVNFGLRLGKADTNGPIWVVVENVVARSYNTGLVVEGIDWANALKFDTCFFTGDVQGGLIKVGGGFGSIAPLFINTEFAGDGYGLTIDNASNVTVVNGYFESKGPSIRVMNRCYGLALRDCVYGSLTNDNPTGVDSFIYHESGNCRMSISGGYITIPTGMERDNLNFIKSANPDSFILKMTDQPTREVYASGFKVFADGLPTNLFTGFHRADYDIAWTASSTDPTIGNGELKGRYVLSGSTCTVFVELTIGSTTTFGSGDFRFSVPFRSVFGSRAYGSGLILNDVVQNIIPQVNSASSVAALYDENGNILSASSPSPWSAGDTIRFQITYEIE
ncbi:MAG: hypothetical protein CBB72_006980 [Muricauda sp. TMED12]|nr:MAG: hypothetical protein CBB72_006980 [Muricauda sp. TMED12]